jgi:hypothetical protein
MFAKINAGKKAKIENMLILNSAASKEKNIARSAASTPTMNRTKGMK